MATPEGKVKEWLDTMLKREEVWYFSPQAGPYGVSGIPDRIAIVCGLFVGIEVKANVKCKMTALQERCKYNIAKAGGYHFLVYDKETIEQVRQFILNVRASGSRPKGIGNLVTGSRDNIICDTKRQASKRKLSTSTPPPGRNPGPTQPWVPDTGTYPILLQLPGPVQSDGASANYVGLPN